MATNEAEEFEFRLRAEKEAKAKAAKPVAAAPAAAKDDGLAERQEAVFAPFPDLETALHVGSSIVAPVAGQVAGLLGTAAEYATGGKTTGDEGDGPDNLRKYIQDAWTYQPRGAAAKSSADFADTVLSLPGRAISSATHPLGNAIRGDNNGGDTWRGALGNLVEETGNQAAGWVIGKGLKAAAPLASRVLESGIKTKSPLPKEIATPDAARSAAKILGAANDQGHVPSDISGISSKAADKIKSTQDAAQKNVSGQAGTQTTEELGKQAREPLSKEENRLYKQRDDKTSPLAEQARQSTKPIPTQHIIDFLKKAAEGETAEGKALYAKVAKELQGEAGAATDPLAGMSRDQMTFLMKLTPAEQNAFLKKAGENVSTKGITSSNFENRRAFMDDIKKRGIDGQPINQVRSKVIDQAKKMLEDSAEPVWGKFLDKYKQLSEPIDQFRVKGEGPTAVGKVTQKLPLSNSPRMPGSEVTDHLLSSPENIRAAVKAAGSDPAVKNSLETRLWQKLNESQQNNKLSPSAMDTFMKQHGPALKELGLEKKFEMARDHVKAADAIDKTAVGKLAGTGGNPVDSYRTLGKMLDASDGSRAASLKELGDLTKNDAAARQALKTSIVMKLADVTKGAGESTRAAIMNDLEKSGLFTKPEVANLGKFNSVVDKEMKIGPNAGSMGDKVRSMLLKGVGATPIVGKTIRGLGEMGSDTVANKKIAETRQLVQSAATNPQLAKKLAAPPQSKAVVQAIQRLTGGGTIPGSMIATMPKGDQQGQGE